MCFLVHCHKNIVILVCMARFCFYKIFSHFRLSTRLSLFPLLLYFFIFCLGINTARVMRLLWFDWLLLFVLSSHQPYLLFNEKVYIHIYCCVIAIAIIMFTKPLKKEFTLRLRLHILSERCYYRYFS